MIEFIKNAFSWIVVIALLILFLVILHLGSGWLQETLGVSNEQARVAVLFIVVFWLVWRVDDGFRQLERRVAILERRLKGGKR